MPITPKERLFLKKLTKINETIIISKELFLEHYAIINNQLLTQPPNENTIPNLNKRKSEYLPGPFNIRPDKKVIIYPTQIIMNHVLATQILIIKQNTANRGGIVESSIKALMSVLNAFYYESQEKIPLTLECQQHLQASISQSITLQYDEGKIIDCIIKILSLDVTRLKTSRGLLETRASSELMQVTHAYSAINLTDVQKGAQLFLKRLGFEHDASIQNDFQQAWLGLKREEFKQLRKVTRANASAYKMNILVALFCTALLAFIGAPLYSLTTLVTLGIFTYCSAICFLWAQYNRQVEPTSYHVYQRQREELLQQIKTYTFSKIIKVRFYDQPLTSVLYTPFIGQNDSTSLLMTSHERPTHQRKPKPGKKHDGKEEVRDIIVSHNIPGKDKLLHPVNWNKPDYPPFNLQPTCQTKPIDCDTYGKLFSYIPEKVKEEALQYVSEDVLKVQQTKFGNKHEQGIVPASGYYTNEKGELLKAANKIKIKGSDGKYHVRIFGSEYAKGDGDETGYRHDGFRCTH